MKRKPLVFYIFVWRAGGFFTAGFSHNKALRIATHHVLSQSYLHAQSELLLYLLMQISVSNDQMFAYASMAQIWSLRPGFIGT